MQYTCKGIQMSEMLAGVGPQRSLPTALVSSASTSLIDSSVTWITYSDDLCFVLFICRYWKIYIMINISVYKNKIYYHYKKCEN